MNVGAALDVQQQIEAYSNHVFLQVTQVPEGQDLELLRDIGVSGLIYGSESAKELDLEELRKSIGLLEPRKQKTHAGAVLPGTGNSSTTQEADYEDYDDDEDWE